MKLKKLRDLIDCDLDVEVTGIADDSRNVKEGYVYVATKGFNVDHYDFIDKAIENGCSCVIADREVNYDIPSVIIDDIDNKFYEICQKFYDINLNDFTFIGVTGTDGKTTTTYIIQELLKKFKNVTYIGTNGAVIGDKTKDVHNTTPIVTELYDVLKWSKDNDSFNIVMEVSSEALLHNRVNNFKFKSIGFTNITEDHLNVHKTLENYIESKKKFVNYVSDDGWVIVNGDDKICKEIVAKNIIKMGIDESNDCVIEVIEKDLNYTIFDIHYEGKTYRIKSPFVGDYNMFNVTMAFLICYCNGVSTEYLVREIENLKPVAGRREKLDFGQEYEIILDYAHTLNSIKNIIKTVPKDRDIIVVTGCAGGREKAKRSKIGKFILDNCNTAIFTMDDPRFESVDEIIDQMVQDSDKDYIRIIDRVEAIHKAFDIAKSNSTVLILGKGRDNYMALEDRKDYYCDYDTISSYFDKR